MIHGLDRFVGIIRHPRVGHELPQLDELIVSQKLHEALAPRGVFVVRAERSIGIIRFERGGQPFADPQRILDVRRLHAGVEHQLMNRFVDGSGGCPVVAGVARVGTCNPVVSCR